mmetsp:Transcript_28514/g.90891  ORF Transcript_28514/g.90891 Transcript_28514/m.90891 type:complete len:230 (-) Transcript_28514:575-1264(-)
MPLSTACLRETMLGTARLSTTRLEFFSFRPMTKSPSLGTCTTSPVCRVKWTMQPQGWFSTRMRFFGPPVAWSPALAAARRLPGVASRPPAAAAAGPALEGGGLADVTSDGPICCVASSSWSGGCATGASGGSICTVALRWSWRLAAAGPRSHAAFTLPCRSTTPYSSLGQRGCEGPPRPATLTFFSPLTKTVSSMVLRWIRRPTRSPTASCFSGRHSFVLILETSAPFA